MHTVNGIWSFFRLLNTYIVGGRYFEYVHIWTKIFTPKLKKVQCVVQVFFSKIMFKSKFVKNWNSKFESGNSWNLLDCGEHLKCRTKQRWENLQCVTKRFSPNYLMVDELTCRLELHRPFNYVHSRRPEGSTNWVYPSYFYFKTSWILMERPTVQCTKVWIS